MSPAVPFVEELLEHFDAGDDLLLGGTQADEIDFLAHLDLAALDTAGGDGAAAGDGEDVFDRHEEGLVDFTLRKRNVAVDLGHQLEDGLGARVLAVAVEGLHRRTANHRDVVAREAVVLEQLANFELDEVEELGVVDEVALVEEDHDRGHADLTGEQDVLLGLGHGAVGRGDHQDRAVHLRGAGDHVLDVVGVTRAVDVRVVTRSPSRTRRATR